MQRIACVLVAGLLCASCSTLSVDQAGKLATAGRAGANGLSDYLAVPRQQLASWETGVALAATYPKAAKGVAICDDNTVTPFSKETQDAIEDYLSKLDKARAVLGALDKTYAAYGALVAFDAKADFDTAYSGLLGSLDQYAGKSPGGAAAGAISKAAGGLIVDERRKALAKEGSVKLREAVERLVPALEAHRDSLTGFRQEQVKINYKVAIVLWCDGKLDARPLLKEIGSGYGLDPLGPNPVTATEDSFKNGVVAALRVKAKRADVEEQRLFDKLVKALGELPAKHRKLEAGQPVDTAYITARLGEARAILEAITKAEKS